jgi:FtsH-binding integral membrane protein
MKKKERTTLQTLNGYKAAKVGLYAGVFACPTVPAAITTAVNWNEWFGTAKESLPIGFITMLLTLVASIFAIIKSDTVLKKGTVAIFLIGILFAMIGLSSMFLANLLRDFGLLWLEAGAGIVGGGICYLVEKKGIEPQLTYYQGLVNQNGLDKKSLERLRAKEKARREAEERARREAESYQATE